MRHSYVFYVPHDARSPKFISSWFCRIIVDLLKMNVAPLAVFQTLKAMCAGQKISDTIAPDPATVTEVRGQSSASGSALIMLLNWSDPCFWYPSSPRSRNRTELNFYLYSTLQMQSVLLDIVNKLPRIFCTLNNKQYKPTKCFNNYRLNKKMSSILFIFVLKRNMDVKSGLKFWPGIHFSTD